MTIQAFDSRFSKTIGSDEYQILNKWLSNFKDRNVFYAHGFLCAVLTNPKPIETNTWLATLTTNEVEHTMSADDWQAMLGRLTRLHQQVEKHLSHNTEIYPLVDFKPPKPFFAAELNDEQRLHLRQWCQGYQSGMKLNKTAWQTLSDFKNIDFIVKSLAKQTPSTSALGLAPDHTPQQLENVYRDMIETFPCLLGIIYDQACEISSDKPNHKARPSKFYHSSELFARCPCRSGKAYLHCCAWQNVH